MSVAVASTSESTAHQSGTTVHRSGNTAHQSINTVHQFSAARELFSLAARGLVEAAAAPRADERFAIAQLAALRAAASVVATRSSSSTQRRRISSVWRLLGRAAPELSEWAAFFESQTGRRVVSSREADDHLRDAVTFIESVGDVLGFSVHDLAHVGECLVV